MLDFPKGIVELRINRAEAGTFEAVAGVAGQKIFVLGFWLQYASSSTIDFKSGDDSMTGVLTMTGLAMDPMNVGSSCVPRLTVAEGKALKITTGAPQLSGVIYYVQQDATPDL